jgi:uncharacterized protein (TIGR03437 family)
VCEFVFPGGAQPQTLRARTIRYSTVPAASLAAVQHAGSYLAGVGANTYVSLYGQNLSTVSRGWSGADFQQNNLPTALDGIGVSVNGRPVAVSYISPTQVNALVFSDVPAGPAYLSVTNSLGTSVPLKVNVQALFPGLFTVSKGNVQYAAAVFPDGTLVGPPGLFGPNVVSRPAKPGDIIELYGTGFGPTNPPETPGKVPLVALPLANASQVRVLFGTTPSPAVDFAGISGPGLYQFNVTVPNVADGDQLIVVQIPGSASQSNVFVTVKK